MYGPTGLKFEQAFPQPITAPQVPKPDPVDAIFLMKLKDFAEILGPHVKLTPNDLKRISMLTELWLKTNCNRVLIKFKEIIEGREIPNRTYCMCDICSSNGPQ